MLILSEIGETSPYLAPDNIGEPIDLRGNSEHLASLP